MNPLSEFTTRDNQLATLLQDSNMPRVHFAACLGMGIDSFKRMLSGRIPTPPGVIGDATQLLEDIAYNQAILANPDSTEYKQFLYDYYVLRAAYKRLDTSGEPL